MNKEDKLLYSATIKRLKELARGAKPQSETCGICHDLLMSVSPNVPDVVVKHSYNWIHFSGCSDYPVEGDYLRHLDSKRKWSGRAGKLRRSLCRHIAKQMEKELKCCTQS